MIRLRGNVSVAMSNQPLIYVDGVRIRSDGYQRNVPPTGSDLRSGNDVASPLNDINPNDIERVEIIKGAAAATLYGTEAAAGVIQIFTKSGRTGTPQWTIQVDQGFVHALPFGPDPSKAPPGDTIFRKIVRRDSFPSRFAGRSRLPTRRLARRRNVEVPVHRSVASQRLQQRYSLSVGGGGEALRVLRRRARRHDEEGVLPNDNEARQGRCAATSRSRRSPTCCSPGTRRTRRTTSRTRPPATTRTD